MSPKREKEDRNREDCTKNTKCCRPSKDDDSDSFIQQRPPGGLEQLETTGPEEAEIHQKTATSRAGWMIRGGYCQPSIQMWRLMFFLFYHAYLAYAIYFHTVVAQKDQWDWCEGLGFLLIITALFYLGWTLHHVSQCIRRRKRKWLTNWWPLIQSFDRYYRVTGGFFRFTA